MNKKKVFKSLKDLGQILNDQESKPSGFLQPACVRFIDNENFDESSVFTRDQFHQMLRRTSRPLPEDHTDYENDMMS